MTWRIRRAVSADAPVIADFNRRMAWETEEKVLVPDVVDRGVARVFEGGGRGFYLVAEEADRIVGQLMITFEWSDWRNGWIWWIQSVYVVESHRKLGVFRSLYAHVVEDARSAGDVAGIRLYVENENHRAQRTYESLGMIDPHYQVREMMFADRKE